jgi:glycosidase
MKKTRRWVLVWLGLAGVAGGESIGRVPGWAADAVFYQVMVERFRNGDQGNDPTRESLEFPDIMPAGWAVTPWTNQWYRRAAWERELGDDFYEDGVFHRRLGGDLQGVLERLDYLQDLGVTGIYFNPVFYARSLHKYDGNSFHHVDPYFGPDPAGDLAQMAKETADPATWQWTAADRLFLDVVRGAHARGMRVIIDGVFNHTGRDFFAFADIAARGPQSPYLDWYTIEAFDDPATPENEFKYACWWGVDTLPEFANTADGGDLHPGPKAYIVAATRRWMDPDGDGDPADGVDGWRLDVANEVPDAFWRDWHGLVHELNPQAYTTAEYWDDAGDYLARCGFSATMNYHGFAYPVKGFLVDGRLSARDFAAALDSRRSSYAVPVQYAVQNLIDSHDTDRLASMIVNARYQRPYVREDRNDYDVGERASPRWFRDYDVSRPGPEEQQLLRLVLLFQMSYVGAPMLYAGTEAGMDGADDPDCRMPMVWDDLAYEPRTLGPFGPLGRVEPVAFDAALHDWCRRMIAVRQAEPALRRGDFRVVLAADDAQCIVFARRHEGRELLVALNRGGEPAELDLYLPGAEAGSRGECLVSSVEPAPGGFVVRDGHAPVRLPPLSGAIWRIGR